MTTVDATTVDAQCLERGAQWIKNAIMTRLSEITADQLIELGNVIHFLESSDMVSALQRAGDNAKRRVFERERKRKTDLEARLSGSVEPWVRVFAAEVISNQKPATQEKAA